MSDLPAYLRYALAPTTIILHVGMAALAIGGATDRVIVALAGAAAIAVVIGARSLRTDANVRRASDLLRVQGARVDTDAVAFGARLAEVQATIAQQGKVGHEIRADLVALNGLRERSGRALEIRLSHNERQLANFTTDIDEMTARFDSDISEVSTRCTTLKSDVDSRLSSLAHLSADVDHLLTTRSWNSTRRRKDEKPETRLSTLLTSIPSLAVSDAPAATPE